MVELGYQAGQHELLAEEFLKSYPSEIKNTIKDVLKMISEIKKDLKLRRSSLEKSYKCLEKTKSKYVKGQDELTLEEDFSNEKIRKVKQFDNGSENLKLLTLPWCRGLSIRRGRWRS